MTDASEHVSHARTITRLAVQKRDKSRASVYLNGEFAFGVHQELVLKYGLHKGKTLNVETQQALEQEDRQLRARSAALDYVAHKPRTEGEVRRKLSEKGFEEDAIDAAVGRLKELSYLDDAAYVQEYVRARFSHKGYGPVRLRQELRRRGVDDVLIEDALEAQLDEGALQEAVRDHARKKWQRLDPQEDAPRRHKKLVGYLRRRGFTYDTIRRALDELERAERDEV